MVQKESDRICIVVHGELTKLRTDSKISMKLLSAMGGRAAGMRQKPILILKEQK